eukprot:scaffold546539_cov33-Prasinocladus_malaysianus.AAC.1
MADPTVSTWLVLLGIELCFLAACVVAFEILRRAVPSFYAARADLPTPMHRSAKQPHRAPL